MQAYRLTPAEERQEKIEISETMLAILQTAIRFYRKYPTEALENQIKEVKANYDTYKKNNNL